MAFSIRSASSSSRAGSSSGRVGIIVSSSSCSSWAAWIRGSSPFIALRSRVPGISRRLISLVPSKMRLMRESRYMLFDLVFLHEAVTAVDLHAFVHHVVQHFGAEHLVDRAFQRRIRRWPWPRPPAWASSHRACSVRLEHVRRCGTPCSPAAIGADGHVRQLLPDQAELGDRLTLNCFRSLAYLRGRSRSPACGHRGSPPPA